MGKLRAAPLWNALIVTFVALQMLRIGLNALSVSVRFFTFLRKWLVIIGILILDGKTIVCFTLCKRKCIDLVRRKSFLLKHISFFERELLHCMDG